MGCSRTLARSAGRTLARAERLYDGARQDLDDAEITALQVEVAGEDPRFAGGPLRAHAKLLRSRASDVEAPEELAARHPLYLRRLQFGPNYRADVWAALDADPEATPAEVARRVGSAYETARTVWLDWSLAMRALRQHRNLGRLATVQPAPVMRSREPKNGT